MGELIDMEPYRYRKALAEAADEGELERQRPMKECGVCGIVRFKKGMLKSKYSGEFYCPDINECRERANGSDEC